MHSGRPQSVNRQAIEYGRERRKNPPERGRNLYQKISYLRGGSSVQGTLERVVGGINRMNFLVEM